MDDGKQRIRGIVLDTASDRKPVQKDGDFSID